MTIKLSKPVRYLLLWPLGAAVFATGTTPVLEGGALGWFLVGLMISGMILLLCYLVDLYRVISSSAIEDAFSREPEEPSGPPSTALGPRSRRSPLAERLAR